MSDLEDAVAVHALAANAKAKVAYNLALARLQQTKAALHRLKPAKPAWEPTPEPKFDPVTGAPNNGDAFLDWWRERIMQSRRREQLLLNKRPPLTAEHKAKVSAGLKRRWAERRASVHPGAPAP